MAVGLPVDQMHVLLVGGQDLHRLPLTDADLVLFDRRVVLSDPPGGGDAVAPVALSFLRGETKREEVGGRAGGGGKG